MTLLDRINRRKQATSEEKEYASIAELIRQVEADQPRLSPYLNRSSLASSSRPQLDWEGMFRQATEQINNLQLEQERRTRKVLLGAGEELVSYAVKTATGDIEVRRYDE